MPDMIRLIVNGEPRSFAGPLTVSALLSGLEVSLAAVAVEVNDVIVPRASHGEHRLGEGDRVEVVTFVGGG